VFACPGFSPRREAQLIAITSSMGWLWVVDGPPAATRARNPCPDVRHYLTRSTMGNPTTAVGYAAEQVGGGVLTKTPGGRST